MSNISKGILSYQRVKLVCTLFVVGAYGTVAVRRIVKTDMCTGVRYLGDTL